MISVTLVKKNVTIYGAGYVGLVTGICLAELGHQVLIVDHESEKIQQLIQGISPIYEPGLQDLLVRHLNTGCLSFSTDMDLGVSHGLLQFIAVGTPSSVDGSADLRQVFQVAQDIAQRMSEYRVVIIKSTVPVGTSKKIKQHIDDVLKQRQVMVDFDMVSNPEFLKQGAAIADFMKPDRIIIGTDHERASQQMFELYAAIQDSESKFLKMDIVSAELTKYAANAYLATRISFINEISHLTEFFGADIQMIRQGIGSDARIGPHFLMAGCGFGGSCFPKDVRALIKMGELASSDMPLIRATEAVNQRQKQRLFQKISHYFSGDLKEKTIAVWGLAFKPNTDDMREAPSRVLIDSLLAAGAKICAYDPVAQTQAQKIYLDHPHIQYANQAYSALVGADVLVIVTEWDEFKTPDFAQIRQALKYPAIFDGRNLYESETLAEQGLSYYAIG